MQHTVTHVQYTLTHTHMYMHAAHTHTHTHIHTHDITQGTRTTHTHKQVTHTAHGVSGVLAHAAGFAVDALPQPFPRSETQLLGVVHT